MHDKLKRLFADLTLATLAAQAMGCGDENGIDRSGFVTVACDPSEILAAVRPFVNADYIAIRRVDTGYGPFGGYDSDGGMLPPIHWGIQAQVGNACSNASNLEACQSAVHAISTAPAPTAGERFQLYLTLGDQVETLTTREALVEWLRTIDDPAKAALIVRFVEGGNVSCDAPNAREQPAGIEVITRTGSGCGEGDDIREHLLLIAPDGTSTMKESVTIQVGDPNCAIGRLTSGIAMPLRKPHADLGSYFAAMAALERASIVAFDRLARELEALGAPYALVQWALDAAEDETRHARAVTELARDFGGVVPAAEAVPELPLRGALEIALENAREGCVRETFGALVATHQAKSASDPRIRRTLSRIALDETRHAAFSWELSAWLESALSPSDRAYVDSMRRETVRIFRASLTSELPEAARVRAGLPDDVASRALFSGLERGVWGTLA